jgi:shikimate 5-dehydrogenase
VRSSGWHPTPGSWDILVNATPLGSASHQEQSPLPGGPFDGRLAYDLTYGSEESPFLAEARKAGCATLDGLPMLVAQAERQFEWWTGRQAPRGVMLAAVERRTAAERQGSQRPAGAVAADRTGGEEPCA